MRIVRFPFAGVLALCMLLASLGTMLMAQAPAPGAPQAAEPECGERTKSPKSEIDFDQSNTALPSAPNASRLWSASR